jgi:DNA-binding SARP family transcriptional activator
VSCLLWPDFDARAAANNLHHALYVARRTLEPSPAGAASGYLRLRDRRLALCPDGPHWVDVDALEEAALTARHARQTAAYKAALVLYSGELLPQDRYEGWVEQRRAELRALHLSLLVELAGLYEERGEHEPAIEALGGVVAEKPTNEVAHAGLMRLYALSGRRREALGQYERLREALYRELGTEPEAASKLLQQEIWTGAFPPAPLAPAGSPPQETPSATGAVRHNLPRRRDTFVGREREGREVRRLLAMTGLLTLTGAGGSGKTRLALEVAGGLVEAYPDGAWLVELAPLSDPVLVPQAVAGALGVREIPGRSLEGTIRDHLRRQNLLLVVDNCEHLVDPVARLVEALLESCPRLRVLATSRDLLVYGVRPSGRCLRSPCRTRKRCPPSRESQAPGRYGSSWMSPSANRPART